MSAPDGEGNSKTHSSFLKFLNFVLHLVSLLSNKVLQTKKPAENFVATPHSIKNRNILFALITSLIASCLIVFWFSQSLMVWCWHERSFDSFNGKKIYINTRHKSLFVV